MITPVQPVAGQEFADVDLRGVVFALTEALDLTGVNDVFHGKRVGMMAAEVGRTLGWPVEETDRLFDAGLLHDCGVSTTYLHRRLVVELDWDGAEAHSRTGEQLLRASPVAGPRRRIDRCARCPRKTGRQRDPC